MLSPDRNKTLTTRKITAAVVTWLDNHGFKPVEAEVTVAAGWKSDIAGLIDFTEGEAIALHLAPRKPTWKTSNEKYRAMREAFEKAYKLLPSPTTLLVEVKTSISDLKGDSKWQRQSPTDLRYVAVPPELLSRATEIVPELWGILMVTTQGVCVKRWAKLEAGITLEHRFMVTYNVALRRDHRTRHAALRETMKAARATRNREVLTPDRWSCVARAVLDVCDGGRDLLRRNDSVEAVLAYHRVGKLPEWLIVRLRELWDIKHSGVVRPLGVGELLSVENAVAGNVQENA